MEARLSLRETENRTIWVYRVDCAPSGKSYYGICSCKPRRRWRRHVCSAMANKPRNRNCPALHGAIRKYGESAFTVTVVYEAASWQEACAVERTMIAQHGTLAPGGYNLTLGGDGRLGHKMSDELRQRFLAFASRPHSRELIEKRAAAIRGLKRSQATIELHRERMRVFWADPSNAATAKAAMTAGRVGSPAFIEAQRKRWLGRKHTPETRAKMSAWQVGKKHSEETKRRMSEARKAGNARRKA